MPLKVPPPLLLKKKKSLPQSKILRTLVKNHLSPPYAEAVQGKFIRLMRLRAQMNLAQSLRITIIKREGRARTSTSGL